MKGFVFLGTPHKGCQSISIAILLSAFSYLRGSSPSLLKFIRPKSAENERLQRDFMRYIQREGACGPNRIACVYETLKEEFLGLPTDVVSGCGLKMLALSPECVLISPASRLWTRLLLSLTAVTTKEYTVRRRVTVNYNDSDRTKTRIIKKLSAGSRNGWNVGLCF